MPTNNRIEGKAVLITVSDLHINSTVALSIPVVNLDDGGTYHTNRTQKWLWSVWGDLWGILERDYPSGAWRRVLVINGDLGELDTKKRSLQLISTNKATIQTIVTETIKPALEWADSVFVMRGTPAHIGKSAWLEESIADDVGAVRETQEGAASWWHMRAVVEGVRLDVAHHATMGGMPWNRPGAALRLASKALWQYKVQRDQPPPDLMIRSHNHICTHATLEGVDVWFTPSWTTLTEYGYRAGFENELAHVGALVTECEAGKQITHPVMYELKGERRLWTLKI